MLQRLKLQQGRESQAYLHAPLPPTAASTCGQDGETGPSNLEKVNNSHVNGYEFSINGIPSKEYGISAVDGNFGLKGGEIQQPSLGCEVDRGFISFPTHKGNTDGDTGDNRVLGQAKQTGINPTGTGQLFPAKSLRDADITSFERTDEERVSFGRHTPDNKYAVTSMGQNQVQDRGFTPRVNMWSSKPKDANLDLGHQEDKMFHMGNGGYGALAQSKDMQNVSTDQKTTSSSPKRKQRSSENKTKRWTQKIKERWRDRPGSFGKKRKEDEQRENQKCDQGTEMSPQNKLMTAETLINTSNKVKESIPPSLDSSDPSKTPLTHTEDSTKQGYTRSASGFEFGLGSFSLLEEIVTGQEWAKFLNPNYSTAPVNQGPSEALKTPPNPHDSSQSSLNLNHRRGLNNQWSFRGTEASSVSAAFLPTSMDISEGKQQQYVYKEADQSEPMEHAHMQLEMQSGDSGLGQHLRPPSFVQQPADILNNLVLKSRTHLNRKRQHQSAESRDQRLQAEKITDAKEADREESISSQSLTSSHVMVDTGQSQHDSVMPLYILNSPLPPPSPSFLSPFASAPKGVLKLSISQNSESSVEIETKRRRVEENRRVHFSEDVVTIVPPELDLEATDSEEDSGAEEDSVIGQECEVEQATIEEEAPARRPALPAWILALKRRNTRRKHRY